MAAILSVTINKTDKNDAQGIADAMRCNHYKKVNLRKCEDNSISIFLNSRSILAENRVLLKNTIRGFLKTYGLCFGEVSHDKFSKAVYETLSVLPTEAIYGIESLLKSYDLIIDYKFINNVYVGHYLRCIYSDWIYDLQYAFLCVKNR